MTEEKLAEVVVSKEDAVFWMDRFGRWHNEHGPFEHKKIIDYFNASIRRDESGYFVGQVRENVHEKVYFKYEETPLFVVDVITGDTIVLALNTGATIDLLPDRLFVRNDNLYMSVENDIIKFTDRVLLKLSAHLDIVDDIYYFVVDGQRTKIPSK